MTRIKLIGLSILFALLLALGVQASSLMLRFYTDKTTNAAGDQAGGWNVVEGFAENGAAEGSVGATIGGGGEPGSPNRVTDDWGTIAGGVGNQAGNFAAVGGGSHNAASAARATVGGGFENAASIEYATIGGGWRNTASATRATVGGGASNVAGHMDATVGGGGGNTASGRHATVSGGTQNTASGLDATVSGGSYNVAAGTHAVVGGGARNIADGFDATVGGGAGNTAADNYATVGGGLSNHATSMYAAIGGGYGNTAGGAFSSVPGGADNVAAGDYSLVAGRRAVVEADHAGAFLFADATDADFNSAAANEFAVRATGGVRLVSAVSGDGQPAAGVELAPGSGSWSSLSDRAAKANVTPVDGTQILAALAQLPIASWHYTTQDPSVQHIGPMAQDFYAAFGVGEDERHISTVDADGVALAAIQGLYQTVRDQESHIAALEARLAALEGKHTTGVGYLLPVTLLTLGMVVGGALTYARLKSSLCTHGHASSTSKS